MWLWVTGAGATLVLTFAAMVLFVRARDPGPPRRVRLMSFGPRSTVICMLRLVAVAVFVLSVVAGFVGVQEPYRNLLPTMVWIVWWVGFAFVCALLGDLWALVNPLSTLFAWSESLHARLTGRPLSFSLAYPAWLGAWPAVALFFAFAWAELVWRDNDVPAQLACVVLAYSAITWLGMLLFGRRVWLAHGEAFSIAFGLLARFAPLEAVGGELRLRIPGAGLLSERAVSSSMLVFVILMLATVTFDGFLETPLLQQWSTALQETPQTARLLFALSEAGMSESELLGTLGLLLFPLAFLAVYAVTMWGTGALGSKPAARRFVLSLVPIAVAYHLAHYFSLLLTAGQFIIPLASDPFGFGWDLFGTAGYKVDLAVLDPYVFWYGAVALIVAGHVIAVAVAHIEAIRAFGAQRALVAGLPMLALMVAYTMLSLWILAQPIVG